MVFAFTEVKPFPEPTDILLPKQYETSSGYWHKHETISGSSSNLFQKSPKVFELPLFAIFNYINSHSFFNTKTFYNNFFFDLND